MGHLLAAATTAHWAGELQSPDAASARYPCWGFREQGGIANSDGGCCSIYSIGPTSGHFIVLRISPGGSDGSDRSFLGVREQAHLEDRGVGRERPDASGPAGRRKRARRPRSAGSTSEGAAGDRFVSGAERGPLESSSSSRDAARGSAVNATAATALPPGFPAGADSPPALFPTCRALHHRDIDKPTKLNGNIDKWLPWAKSFKKFLRRTDAQWPEIFEKIEGLKGKPVPAALELEWAAKLGLGSMDPWKEQLHDALEYYTTGAARKLVNSGGEARSLDC